MMEENLLHVSSRETTIRFTESVHSSHIKDIGWVSCCVVAFSRSTLEKVSTGRKVLTLARFGQGLGARGAFYAVGDRRTRVVGLPVEVIRTQGTP